MKKTISVNITYTMNETFSWSVPEGHPAINNMETLKAEIEKMLSHGYTKGGVYVPKSLIMDNYVTVKDEPRCSLCTCDSCSSYEDGHCFHYGGHCDGDVYACDCDCIHGTDANILTYQGEQVSDYSFYSDLDPKDLVDYLLKTDDPDLAPLKDDLMAFFGTMKDIEPEGWRYEDVRD